MTSPSHPPRRGRTAAALALLCLASAAALWPALQAGFVYDDHLYVDGNPGVTAGLGRTSLWWALSTFHAANWHPLAWLSHQLDVTLFGLDPRGHHAVSLALHAANACLLFLVLRAATGVAGRSLAVAALFAVHPLHVESAAWVAERKDVLSTLFALLAAGAWVRHARRPAAHRVAAAAALLALALLAKPMPVTLPALLVLLEIWPLGRLPLFGGFPGSPRAAAWRRTVFELTPLLALALASSAVTLAAQRAGGALTATDLPFAARAANALLSVAAYLRQALWPTGLAVFYPHPGDAALGTRALAAGALLAAASAAALLQARRRPHLAVGWAWFLAALLPVLGLVQVGQQARADRYTYLPLAGVFLAAVWTAASAAAASAGRRRIAAALGAVLVAALAAAAARQATFWRDDATLFARALAVTPDNWVVRTNLGTALSWQGRHAEALGHLERGAALRPDAAQAWQALGTARLRAGRPAEAEAALRRALRLRPDDAEALAALGESLARQRRLPEAATALARALELQPGLARAAFVLGVVAAARGDLEEAAARYRRALELEPRLTEASLGLAWVLERRGDREGAARVLRDARRLAPADAAVREAAAALGIEVDKPAPGP